MRKLIERIIVTLGRKKFRKFTKEPIYIGGCGRSGTTLLLAILASHPDIYAFPKELRPFKKSFLFGDELLTPKFFRLYRALIFRRIKRSANRYCEKSPVNIKYIREIDHFHRGQFKFIHIVRDGRDAILSKHPKRKKEYWISPERWIKDVSAGINFEDHPCVLTIRYEDLVTEFENTLEHTCTFLDIEFSEEIKNWYSHTNIKKYPAIYGNIRELYASSIGKWKKEEHRERVGRLTENSAALNILKHFRYIE